MPEDSVTRIAITTGVDSKGNRVKIAASVGPGGKVRTAMVRSSGNAEQDEAALHDALRPTDTQSSSPL